MKKKLTSINEKIRINTQIVRYFQEAHGYLAWPKGKERYPGIVMIHDYWGLNEEIKQLAQRLAKNGYNVLVVDLFYGQVTSDPERAMKLIKTIGQSESLKNMRAAASYLRAEFESERIASIGWGFGGSQSLQLGLSGEKINGIVIYCGNVFSGKEFLKKLTCPVLGIFGERDELVSVGIVKEFEKSLKTLQIENEIYVYPGKGHSFANPLSSEFSPIDAKDAWEKTLAFLNRNLKYFRKIKVEIKE
ncbi:MAG: Dienelactone hydrolase family protein [uncultured bacterium]|nr:MAG: Dienelactone hydrolase family protein [uncultured bacterium]